MQIRNRVRPILIAVVMVFVIIEIVALSPSSLEQPKNSPNMLKPEQLTESKATTLATGIPKNKIADYSIDRFDYVSTQAGAKQWKLLADKAFIYNGEKLVHARQITAYLYDSQNKITTVTGLEAKYFMNDRDLEIFGNVVTKFPDGFETRSEYLRYRPRLKKVEIPESEPVEGNGSESDGQIIAFTSMGMNFAMDRSIIDLKRSVKFTMTRRDNAETTKIESDHCSIDRTTQLATFTMNQKRPQTERYVTITQKDLYTRAHEARLNYGDYSDVLNYLVTEGDTLIKETGAKTSLKYATAGRADFDTKKNIIILKNYPQVYQDNDTVTGDIIIMHRDTDVVEVEHSNAFSEGTPESSK